MTVERSVTTPQTVVIGAGPAGLTAAYELAKARQAVTVLEASDAVGGISRTVQRDGWRFDIGGHRFFTKVPEVEALWHEILSDEDFLMRPRMSRIFYGGKPYDYPLHAKKSLRGLGVLEAIRCLASYVLVQLRPPKDQSTFEGWVAARFGWRLYRIFFKTYTEKVWGDAGDRDPGRLGRAADQEPLPDDRGHPGGPAVHQQEERRQPHRGVPVPQARPGAHVGALPCPRRAPRWRDPHADDRRGGAPRRWARGLGDGLR